MSLFSRNSDLPGEHGALRACTPGGKGMKKFVEGDFAVINAANISRQEAQMLVDIKPAAVLNVAEFTTGSIPNYGPHMLLDAGVTLIEGVGEEFVSSFKDGKKARINEEGVVFIGDTEVATGKVVSREKAEKNFSSAQRELIDHMEAFFGNSIEFIHSEGPLLIDGLGVPDSGTEMAGRKVLVVSPSTDHRNKVKLLRNFIREYEPIIIGVDSAADTVVDLGYKPHFIVGDPSEISSETFPAAPDAATDLALLLADYHGAQMIVQVGRSLDLDDIFAKQEHATPAAMLSRMKAGTRLVDADSVINLYTNPSSGGIGWLWALLGILVALAVIVIIVGLGGDASFGQNLIDTWNNFALSVQGWFK